VALFYCIKSEKNITRYVHKIKLLGKIGKLDNFYQFIIFEIIIHLWNCACNIWNTY